MSKTLTQLNKLSVRLYDLIEDLNGVMSDIDNNQLFIRLESDMHDIHNQLETTAVALDEVIDDIDNGLYEDEPQDEGDLDWD